MRNLSARSCLFRRRMCFVLPLPMPVNTLSFHRNRFRLLTPHLHIMTPFIKVWITLLDTTVGMTWCGRTDWQNGRNSFWFFDNPDGDRVVRWSWGGHSASTGVPTFWGGFTAMEGVPLWGRETLLQCQTRGRVRSAKKPLHKKTSLQHQTPVIFLKSLAKKKQNSQKWNA